jgi:hypothetical protein
MATSGWLVVLLTPPDRSACEACCSVPANSVCLAAYAVLWLHAYVAAVGESDVYLHLRVKDEATAGGLYYKAGFRSFKKDWPLLLLLGQEPRYLMRKQLSTPRPLVGRVVLLGEQQNEGEQQQQQQMEAGSAEQNQGAAAVQVTASSAALHVSSAA